MTLSRPNRIDVAYTDGPFRYLNNHWVFEPVRRGVCRIDFFVDFEFRSRILQKLIGMLFDEAVRRMVAAFEGRARDLYGAKTAKKPGEPETRAQPSALPAVGYLQAGFSAAALRRSRARLAASCRT